MSCSTDGTDVKRDCPLLGDVWIKIIETLVINVKLIEELDSFPILQKKFRLKSLQTQLPSEICTEKGYNYYISIALMYKTELYSTRRYKSTHF